MYKAETKIFVIDSKRPMWLINLQLNVNYWLKDKNFETNAIVKDFIMTLIKDTRYVRRNDIQPLINFVRIEETDDTITIRTLYKDRKMIEFKIVEVETL